VNNANEMFEYDERRRIRIHPRAKALITALSNFIYKPDTSIPKKDGFDHLCDAMGYLLWSEFNVLQRNSLTVTTFRI